MRIVGIDPGYAIVGYGVIEYSSARFRTLGYGDISTQAGTAFERRLEMIYDGLAELIEKAKPEAFAMEELFFTTNQKTAIYVAEARGVMLLCAKKHGVPVFEYTPLQVKQSVVGYGKAEKNQVMQMVKTLLGLEAIPKPDDVADALAVAVCHAHSAGSRIREGHIGGRRQL